MKYLVVNVLHDKQLGDHFLYAAINKIQLARNKIGEILYMRIKSHFLIILYFVNNILRNKKSSSFSDNGKDRGSCTERSSVLYGLLLYKALLFYHTCNYCQLAGSPPVTSTSAALD